LTETGRVTALEAAQKAVPTLVRVQTGLQRRTNRHLSKIDGLTGLCARILKLVPSGPQEYVVVETLAVTLQVHREDVRAALTALVSQGLVEPFTFAQGYRTGWRRVTSPREESVQ
jgi:Fic family protein